MNKVYQIVTDRIVALMATGIIPWKPCSQGASSGACRPINGYSEYAYFFPAHCTR